MLCRAVQDYTLTAAMKLTARLPAQVARLRAIIERYTRSPILEVQARWVAACLGVPAGPGHLHVPWGGEGGPRRGLGAPRGRAR